MHWRTTSCVNVHRLRRTKEVSLTREILPIRETINTGSLSEMIVASMNHAPAINQGPLWVKMRWRSRLQQQSNLRTCAEIYTWHKNLIGSNLSNMNSKRRKAKIVRATSYLKLKRSASMTWLCQNWRTKAIYLMVSKMWTLAMIWNFNNKYWNIFKQLNQIIL